MKKSMAGILCWMMGAWMTLAATPSDTLITVSRTRVEIHFTDVPVAGVILVLPGWNFPQDDVCLKSDFCAKARRLGYVLVMPDMKKSVYQHRDYPETRVDWRVYPTLPWLTDTLLPFLRQHYHLLVPGQRNFLFGISTGARGVGMMACYTGNLFMAGAALSGDYDQEAMPTDNLMKGYYGPMASFPDRWNGEDNLCRNAFRVTIPLFLAHGLQDKIVPPNQTVLFYEALTAANKHLPHRKVMKEGAGHDYSFWSSMYDEVFRFIAATGK